MRKKPTEQPGDSAVVLQRVVREEWLGITSNSKQNMKIKVPAKTVEACDICERQCAGSLLTKCVVCGKEYCHICEAIMAGCIHQPDVCKKCSDHEAVRATVEKFAQPLMDILKLRDKSLAKLRRVMPNG